MFRSRMKSFNVDEAMVTSMVEQLLVAGADVNARTNHEGMTALLGAAREGHTDAAALLIQAGSDVSAKTNVDAFTPLIEAAKGGYEDMVKLLLEAGADPQQQDRIGRSAIDWGADYPEIVTLLGGQPASTEKETTVKEVTPEQREQASRHSSSWAIKTLRKGCLL